MALFFYIHQNPHSNPYLPKIRITLAKIWIKIFKMSMPIQMIYCPLWMYERKWPGKQIKKNVEKPTFRVYVFRLIPAYFNLDFNSKYTISKKIPNRIKWQSHTFPCCYIISLSHLSNPIVQTTHIYNNPHVSGIHFLFYFYNLLGHNIKSHDTWNYPKKLFSLRLLNV